MSPSPGSDPSLDSPLRWLELGCSGEGVTIHAKPLALALKIQVATKCSCVVMLFLTNTCSSMCSAKALEVTQQTNCLRHFIPECEEQLQEIQRQKEKGLLYGIPVSIKDHISHKVLPFVPMKCRIVSWAGW